MTIFEYNQHRDTNDGKPWSDIDLDDLRSHAAAGATLEETAAFLCRSGSVEDLAAKAREVGATFE